LGGKTTEADDPNQANQGRNSRLHEVVIARKGPGKTSVISVLSERSV
jgi:hypothetical protein